MEAEKKRFEDCVMSTFSFKTESGRLSSSDPIKYIYLEPYLEFITDGRVRGIVPQMRSTSLQAEMASVVKARAQMQMESVIQELGRRLQQYQEEFFSGDTSRFRAFHEWLGWDAWKLKKKFTRSESLL